MSNSSVFLWALTAPRSTMKQSPLLKLAQSRGTSVALTTRLPLMWKRRLALRSLVTTCWNPDATPPAWNHKETMFFTFLLCKTLFNSMHHSCLKNYKHLHKHSPKQSIVIRKKEKSKRITNMNHLKLKSQKAKV